MVGGHVVHVGAPFQAVLERLPQRVQELERRVQQVLSEKVYHALTRAVGEHEIAHRRAGHVRRLVLTSGPAISPVLPPGHALHGLAAYRATFGIRQISSGLIQLARLVQLALHPLEVEQVLEERLILGNGRLRGHDHQRPRHLVVQHRQVSRRHFRPFGTGHGHGVDGLQLRGLGQSGVPVGLGRPGAPGEVEHQLVQRFRAVHDLEGRCHRI
mmetsp:Transcript_2391/g.7430  ORF Transcript_2391/g.7430 Transcript_2391/m.7430 type:complete len:213 (-) Transcript_2391:331-969(-)